MHIRKTSGTLMHGVIYNRHTISDKTDLCISEYDVLNVVMRNSNAAIHFVCPSCMYEDNFSRIHLSKKLSSCELYNNAVTDVLTLASLCCMKHR